MKQFSAVTRQELLRLKKRLAQVYSGYKLLEEKRDALIKTFMELKEAFAERKERLFFELKNVIRTFDFSIKNNQISLIDFLLYHPESKIEIGLKSKSIMGVKTTLFTVENISLPEMKESNYPKSCYYSLKKLSELIPELIEVASIENALIRLAIAIEKTRRRVNVLRDVIIPEMKSQIRYISLKLADQEREGFVFNLKFKEKRKLKD